MYGSQNSVERAGPRLHRAYVASSVPTPKNLLFRVTSVSSALATLLPFDILLLVCFDATALPLAMCCSNIPTSN